MAIDFKSFAPFVQKAKDAAAQVTANLSGTPTATDKETPNRSSLWGKFSLNKNTPEAPVMQPASHPLWGRFALSGSSTPSEENTSFGPLKQGLSIRKSSIGSETTPYGGSTRFEKFHPGVDIGNKIGTSIPATVGGTVVEAVSGRKQGEKNYGNYIIIKDAQGNLHRYSHLSKGYVKIGQQVSSGDEIGLMGNTGNVYSTSGGTGSHLDYRVKGLFGKYLDPYQFFK